MIVNTVKRVVNDFMSLCFPCSCSVCEGTAESGGVCSDCLSNISYIPDDRCRKCGKLLEPYAGELSRCNECRTTHYFFRHTYAFSQYGSPVREMIHGLKYGKDFSIIPALNIIVSKGIRSHMRGAAYDCAVPVPLFVTDRMRRGFNQSAMLARIAADILDIPCSHILSKKRSTHTQVSLSRVERKQNLEGAFSCRSNILKGKTILLVDDVFTSGSTLSECAKVLKKKGGADNVDVLVVAR